MCIFRIQSTFMKYFGFILAMAFLVFSCSNEEMVDEERKEKDQVEVEAVEEVLEEEQEAVPAEPPVFAHDGRDFACGGFIVSIDSMMSSMTDEGNSFKMISPKNDTCRYDMDLGETIDGSLLRISPTKTDYFTKFEVYQRKLGHFTISREGPHCDILDRTPYYSDWELVPEIKKNYSFGLFEWDKQKLPTVVMSDEEFKEIVLEHCGEGYANFLGSEYHESTSAADHLGVSGYEIKIVATLLDGTEKTYIISIGSPMGC